MAADGKQLQPIIVKKKKTGGHGHHGGAWKIAYADFVTAMMAFFLLMWLLGSTSKGDLQGIASYFSQPVKVSLMGGSGTGDNTSILPGGGPRLDRSAGNVALSPATDGLERSRQEMREMEARADARRLNALRERITQLLQSRPGLSEHLGQIRLESSQDGLRIEISDDQKRPMFDLGSARLQPYLREILREIGSALNEVDNPISLAGHTDATQYVSGDRGYSNWELSADRAMASRRELVLGGMKEVNLVRVSGMAATELLDPQNPSSPLNRRISLMVMTREAAARLRNSPVSNSLTPVGNP
jgi:chemotaxis protein MotB